MIDYKRIWIFERGDAIGIPNLYRKRYYTNKKVDSDNWILEKVVKDIYSRKKWLLFSFEVLQLKMKNNFQKIKK